MLSPVQLANEGVLNELKEKALILNSIDSIVNAEQ